MLDHVDAVKAALAHLPYNVYFAWAVNNPAEDVHPPYPYIVLEPRTERRPDEMPVSQSTGEVSFVLWVRAVGRTATSVIRVQQHARAALAPSYTPHRIPLAGRSFHLSWLGSEGDSLSWVDRDVTLPQTNLHPSVSVSAYRAWSEPA